MKRPSYKSKIIDKFDNEYKKLAYYVVQEINKVRTNPKFYIEILQNDKQFFKNNILYRIGEAPLNTSEGPAAHDEAIEYLQNQVSLEALVLDERLSNAAKDHVEDIGINGMTSHEGSNKETISDRVEKYAEWDFTLCQNIDFGGKNVHEIMISFLTSDGDKTRSHRENLFRSDLKYLGCYSGPHKEVEYCTVVIYSGNVREIGSTPPEIKDWLEIYKRKQEELKNISRKKKTKYQIIDPNAPDNAISFITSKKIKLINGLAKNVTQRIYTSDDGSQHIIEEFEDLRKVNLKK